MVIKKYSLTLRNFNSSITHIILKYSGYNSIEEYEFETKNPNFEFFIDTVTKHVTCLDCHHNYNLDYENYTYMNVPLSYLTNETKQYFFYKYIVMNGFLSFDEYFIYYNYSMPYVFVNIPKKQFLQTQLQQQSQQTLFQQQTQETLFQQQTQETTQQNEFHAENNNYIDTFTNDDIFEIEPIIDFKNLYCKRTNKKLMVRPFNFELDYSIRPNDYKKKIWNIFNNEIKYNKYHKAWVFPLIYKKQLLENGVIFI
jgi:hypothetical protein